MILNEIFADIRIQQSLALLLIAFSITLGVAGIIIRKTRFFDFKDTTKASGSISFNVGRWMTAIGILIGSVALLVFIYSLTLD